MRRLAPLLLLCAVLPSCTVGVRRAASPAPSAPTSSARATPPRCSTAYAVPDPARPRIAVTFAADAHDPFGVYHGTERVSFTPDLPVTEVVFRLWANDARARGNGARMVVTRGSLPLRSEALGGTDDLPTLVALRLPAPSPAGRRVDVSLDFTLTLPNAAVDRWGHSADLAWWGTGHPLLAWVRGEGWRTEPAAGVLGETATSEVADYDLTVDAPAAADVVANGARDGDAVPAGESLRRWHFRAPAVRDLAVAVGRFTTRETTLSGVHVTAAVAEGLARGAAAEAVLGPVLAHAAESLPVLRAALGPYPFPSLTFVALAPVEGAGIEYPGLIFVGTRRYDGVVPHEIAHQWFYGLVGDDQARDPWLDEAFATYGESLVNDSGDRYLAALDADGSVGEPMSHWASRAKAYSTIVYWKGAAGLLAARDTVGAAAFDGALRCYVAANAHRVATPADVEKAFASLPEVVHILRETGALPG